MHGRDVVIVGGGFFGCYLSEYLTLNGLSVKIIEASDELMVGATRHNQARVHNGYHYPRSIITAARSRISYQKFLREFGDACDDTSHHRYLISRFMSKVSAKQFEAFCKRIGASYQYDTDFVRQFCNPAAVEAAFSVKEAVFDASVLRDIMLERLSRLGANINLGATVTRVERDGDGVRVFVSGKDGDYEEVAKQVICCGYDGINSLFRMSELPLLPFKQELTEICLVDVPNAVKELGLTVMCGPFFSLMPHPTSKGHSLSHVRYTPHASYLDGNDDREYEEVLSNWRENRRSKFKKMRSDASRFVPILKDVTYSASDWAVKTVLQASEANDSRPIYVARDCGIKNFHAILGGKIDNVYDMIDYIKCWDF